MPSLNDLDRLDPITVLMYLNLFQVSKLNPLISASTAEMMARSVCRQWVGYVLGAPAVHWVLPLTSQGRSLDGLLGPFFLTTWHGG